MDYSKYTINELIDCVNNIDKDTNPENYKKLITEIDKRKPDIEAFKNKQHEEFSFSTENKIKLLSWLQIATSVGFLIAFINVLLGSMEPTDLIIYSIIASFNGVAGYRLLKRASYGFELSYINQILQIVTFNTGTLFFTYTGLGSFLVGIESSTVFFNFSILNADFRLYVGEALGQFTVGVDLVAVFFIFVLNSCKELGLHEKANKAFKPNT